ncbi:MAG: hypothetical protein HQK82_10730 [Desulfovibrionaceae bacterium]|nr:hypothetical protein [Desulfovibrionaceae bacterium]
MRRVLLLLVGFILFVSVLIGCDSTNSKLEAEKARLEIEKLKREAEADAALKQRAAEYSEGAKKLRDYKPSKDPF